MLGICYIVECCLYQTISCSADLCNLSTKITLFQAYCAPMYTSNLWWKFKNLSLKSITVAQNNSLRILIKLPSRCSASFMCAINYIKSYNEHICSSKFSLLSRLHQSENPLFVNYFHTYIYFRSSMFIYWRS